MAVRKCSACCQLFRVFRGRALFVQGVMHPYFQWAFGCPGGMALLESHGAFTLLMRKTLHRHRAGFEPQRA
jgi:hypothetical protein